MKIASITIKNIRGLQNHNIQLDMIPNKPSLLVAPNGSGKSSFAIAFQSLIRGRVNINEDNIFSRNTKLIPEVIMNVDGRIYRANSTVNEISRAFGVAVINSRTKPVVIKRKINGVNVSISRLSVEPIVLEDHIPRKVNLCYDFGATYEIALKKGVVPAINSLLAKNLLYVKFPISELKRTGRTLRQVSDIIDLIKRLNESDATRDKITSALEEEVLPKLKSLSQVEIIAEVVKDIEGGNAELTVYLKAMQLLLKFCQEVEAFKANKEYAEYYERKQAYCELFDSLKDTWQNIKPKETQGKLLIEIPNASLISNGERDIIIFLAMLEKAKLALKKAENILIIDEVFDYLDDANLVAAQYYISEFIKKMKAEGKEIFPIILTHLNPDYYKHYAFKDLKVYYLLPLPSPHKSNLMMILLRKREELDKSGAEDVISKYMLHFHADYTRDMSDILNQEQKDAGWNEIEKYKEYCNANVENYLGGKEFCPLAVCVMLREWVERYCYEKLREDYRDQFLAEHGTQKKLNYAEEKGVEYPEVFSLLGLIYNDPLHATDKKDLRQTLYSRLHNNTIRAMIGEVKALGEES